MRLYIILSLLIADAIAFSFRASNRACSRLCAQQQAAACPLIGGNRPFTPAPGSLEGQTIVITGGTGGLGLESAKRLAVGGASIILTARSVEKAERAVSEVMKYAREKNAINEKVSFKLLNLDDLRDVRNVPETWKDVYKIDVLLNNAGIMALPKLELTVDGLEKQMQSNHLGHFALTALLSSKLEPDARVINVSSSAHQFAPKGMLSGDVLWKPDSFDYSGWPVYGQSKLANILFTKELQRRCEAAGKDWYVHCCKFRTYPPFFVVGLTLCCVRTVACLHPGVVATGKFTT
jgi:NAD(P)-dependent dehydrogenase (short-subunit alcohol dehydrogenase family)